MEIALVLLIALGAIYLFISEKYPGALVSMMVVGVLILVALLDRWVPWIRSDHWITPNEGVSGFSHPATITVAAMFVLSAGLQSTGVIAGLNPWLGRMARRPFWLLLVLLGVITVVSAFVNNTAAVAIFLPIALAACARGGRLAASQVLIPLSYAAQIGGVCTLIGTSANLVVSAMSEQGGHGAFGMFEFTRLGLILAGTGLTYLLVAGRWLLPRRAGRGLVQNFQVADYITELRVVPGSPLAGRTVRESRFGATHQARLCAVLRHGRVAWPAPDLEIEMDDVLLVLAPADQLIPLRADWRLASEPEFRFSDETLRNQNLRLAEAVIAPRSWLIGRTLREADFRRRFACLVLGVQGREPATSERLADIRLNSGDALLLLGRPEDIASLRGNRDFLLLERVEEPALRRAKIPLALAIFGTVVALTSFNVVPILASALFGCVALVATGCLSIEEAYEAIDWKVIFLLAGMLPLGLAMQKSGAADLLARGAVGLAQPWGPVAVLAALYLVTAVLTEFMSNTAAAVLLAPVAIAVAAALGINSRPLLMAVCFAASTSFCTPVGYQTNAMVQHPGGYRFADYLRAGLPLNVLFWLLSVHFIPRFWPF